MATEIEIKKLHERNKRVEADKAWETSNIRRGIISVTIYFFFVLFLYLIEAPQPWLNSFVPTLAFVISTLTLPFLKNWWIKNIYKPKAKAQTEAL